MLSSCAFCSFLFSSFCSLVILSKWLLCYSCNHRHNILLIHSLVNSFYQFYLQNFQQMLLFTPRHSQNRIFSAFCCFQCVLQTQCSYSWRSRSTFMEADFHAGKSLELLLPQKAGKQGMFYANCSAFLLRFYLFISSAFSKHLKF